MTKNVEFSGYYFYMKMTIKEDFQICSSVTLMCGMSIEQKYCGCMLHHVNSNGKLFPSVIARKVTWYCFYFCCSFFDNDFWSLNWHYWIWYFLFETACEFTSNNLHEWNIFKIGLSPTKGVVFICLNEAPLKIMKNVFISY